MASLSSVANFVVEAVQMQASLALYGNGAGVLNNYKGRRDRARAAAEWQRIEPRLEPDQIAVQLLETGCALVPPCHDPEMLLRIKRAADACFEDPAKWINGQAAAVPGVEVPVRRLRNPLEYIPEIRHLVNDTIAKSVSAYYGAGFRVSDVSIWRNYHIPNPNIDAYSNFWHFDSSNTSHLKLFVNLGDDVDRTSGAFRAHSLARTREIARSGYLHRAMIVGRAWRMVEDADQMFYLEGGLGATALVNTATCLHRAGVPKEGQPRTMINFVVVPSASPFSHNWSLSGETGRKTF